MFTTKRNETYNLFNSSITKRYNKKSKVYVIISLRNLKAY